VVSHLVDFRLAFTLLKWIFLFPYFSLFFVRLPDQLSFVRFFMVYAMAFFNCHLKESGFAAAVTQFGTMVQFSTVLTAKD
jgi:hypothetical protein